MRIIVEMHEAPPDFRPKQCRAFQSNVYEADERQDLPPIVADDFVPEICGNGNCSAEGLVSSCLPNPILGLIALSGSMATFRVEVMAEGEGEESKGSSSEIGLASAKTSISAYRIGIFFDFTMR